MNDRSLVQIKVITRWSCFYVNAIIEDIIEYRYWVQREMIALIDER
jgi:hypothetical protein